MWSTTTNRSSKMTNRKPLTTEQEQELETVAKFLDKSAEVRLSEIRNQTFRIARKFEDRSAKTPQAREFEERISEALNALERAIDCAIEAGEELARIRYVGGNN